MLHDCVVVVALKRPRHMTSTAKLLEDAHHSVLQLPSRSRCACVYTSSRGPPVPQVHKAVKRKVAITSPVLLHLEQQRRSHFAEANACPT